MGSGDRAVSRTAMVPALLGLTAPQGRETIDHTGRRLEKEKAKV